MAAPDEEATTTADDEAGQASNAVGAGFPREDPRQDRIILDTSIVGHLLDQHPKALDLAVLRQLLGSRRVSLADGVVPELVYWFQHHRAGKPMFPGWPAAAAELDRVLDREMPIAPGGHERAALCGLREFKPGFSPDEAKANSRVVWAFLRDANQASDLLNPPRGACGEVGSLAFDERPAEEALRPAARHWADRINAMAQTMRNDFGGQLPDERSLVKYVRGRIFADLRLVPERCELLEPVVHALARRARQAAVGMYAPGPDRSNDVIDVDILYYLPMPAVVCTADGRFLRFLRELRSDHVWRIMAPNELITWLSTGEPPRWKAHTC